MLTAFFDRDGTLISDSGYMTASSEFNLLPGVSDSLILLSKLGVRLVVVSNQSGVGRGIITLDDVYCIQEKIELLLSKLDVIIDAFYYCFHSPSESCMCRKPKSGMFLRAIKEFDLNPRECVMFGDKRTDIVASDGAGIRGFLVAQGSLFSTVSSWTNQELGVE